MAHKLHTCNLMFLRGPHPCHKVKKALDDAGIEYEHVKHPAFPRGKRAQLRELSGQDRLPVIELEDGRVLREESGDMARRILEGRLKEPG